MQQIISHVDQLQLHALYSQCTVDLREYVRQNPGVPSNIKTILKNTIWIEVIYSIDELQAIMDILRKSASSQWLNYHYKNIFAILDDTYKEAQYIIYPEWITITK
jgi:hypothetical protein